MEQIKAFRIFSESGQVSLNGAGDIDMWRAFLVSAANFDVRTNALKSKILRDALFSPDLHQDFSEADFRKVVYKLRDQLEKRQVEEFKVVFPIWNRPDFLSGRTKVQDVLINFSPSRTTPLFKNIEKVRLTQQTSRDFREHFTDRTRDDLKKCSLCIAHVVANNATDANERASEAIYEVLGLVNIWKDSGKYSRLSSRLPGKLPVSEVLIAPHTTTHKSDGSLTHDGFWYENWVGGPSISKTDTQLQTKWAKNYNKLRSKLKKSNWEAECRMAAASYFKAFSNPNLEESFLDGWRLFENIAGARDDKIARKISRIAKLFHDGERYEILGKHLAMRRNLISHGNAIRNDDEEVLAFQMLRFVVFFLVQFLVNPHSFSDKSEFWEFLDLPASENELKTLAREFSRRQSIVKKAAQFRSPTE